MNEEEMTVQEFKEFMLNKVKEFSTFWESNFKQLPEEGFRNDLSVDEWKEQFDVFLGVIDKNFS